MGAGNVASEGDSASSLTNSPQACCFVVPSYKLPPKVRTSAGGRRRGSQGGLNGEERAHKGVFDAVPFTPSQGVRSPSPSHAAVTWNSMYSPFTNAFQGNGVPTDSPNTVLRAHVSSDGGSAPDSAVQQHMAAGSPMHGMPQYSPFMLYPMGPPIPGYLQAEAAGSPMAMPGSPMSPGVVFHPSPFAHGASMGAPGSPHAFFSTPFNVGPQPQPYPMGLVSEGSYPGAAMQSRQAHYYNGTVQQQQQPPMQQGGMQSMGGSGGGAFANPYAQAAYLQAYGHQSSPLAPPLSHHAHQQHHHMAPANNLGLETQFSAPAALHVRRSITGPLPSHHHQLLQQNSSTLGGHMSQHGVAAMAAAAAAAAQQQVAAAPVGQLSRLRIAHSADYSMLEQQLQSVGSAPRRFKARKNSEPKIGPDGQPRLNARQRRTLRRAKERALKGLLEVSQALLQKADVNVQMPNLSALAALEEAAEKADADYAEAEAEYEEGRAAHAAVNGGGSGGSSSNNSSARASPLPNAMTVTKARQEQLSAAVAAAEDAAAKIAAAAVAAVAAHAAGQDTSNAAAAAQAAAAQAVSAVAIPDVPSPNSLLTPSSVSSAPTASRPPLMPVRSLSASAAGSVAAAAATAAAPTSPSPDLDAIDIGGLIAQLSKKKDEGMVDDKLIRDLQIIQSLIGALKAPLPIANSPLLLSPLPSGNAPPLPTVPSGGPTSPTDGLVGASAAANVASVAAGMGALTLNGKPLPKRSFSYSPGMAATALANFP